MRNCFLPDEREAKRHRGFDDVDGALMLDTCRTSVPTSGNTDNAAAAPAADKTLVTTISCGWWESGNARKLVFAPCKELYGNGCNGNCDIED